MLWLDMACFLLLRVMRGQADYARGLTWIKGDLREWFHHPLAGNRRPALDQGLRRAMLDLLDNNGILTIATNRLDGWLQATIVGYGNEAERIYVISGVSACAARHR
jgi:hypothetical protein